MIDMAADLEADIPGITVNASVGRQWSEGEQVLRQLAAQGQLGQVVIVELGTNGPIASSDLAAMMSILAPVPRVIFATVHVDQPWQDQVNQVLEAGVPQYPNARLADWAGLAAQNPEWFGPDGTHLAIGGPGAQAYAALIASLCH